MVGEIAPIRRPGGGPLARLGTKQQFLRGGPRGSFLINVELAAGAGGEGDTAAVGRPNRKILYRGVEGEPGPDAPRHVVEPEVSISRLRVESVGHCSRAVRGEPRHSVETRVAQRPHLLSRTVQPE